MWESLPNSVYTGQVAEPFFKRPEITFLTWCKRGRCAPCACNLIKAYSCRYAPDALRALGFDRAVRKLTIQPDGWKKRMARCLPAARPQLVVCVRYAHFATAFEHISCAHARTIRAHARALFCSLIAVANMLQVIAKMLHL